MQQVVTEREVVAVLQELGKLWHERDPLAHLGGFGPLTVLSLRFGLMGGEPQSFERVEELTGVPREEARKIEGELLTRLAQAGTAA